MNKFISGLYSRPYVILAVILAITAFFVIQLPNIEIDNDVLKFLPKSDPSRLAVLDSEEWFGGALSISVVLEKKDGSIITQEGLSVIKTLSDKLTEISGVDEITSLSSLDSIEGDDAGMVVLPLLEETDGKFDILLLRERLSSWELYDRFIISRDESSSQIIVTMNTGLGPDEREELYFDIEETVDALLPAGYDSYIAGTPAITVLLTTNIKKDLLILIPLVTILILLVLYLSFGHLGGVILPVLTVLISTVWTTGLMAFLHIPLSILGTIIPILLIAIGSAYGIHIINHYYDHMNEFDETTRKELVIKVVREVGQPVFLAGLTTMIGFASLAVSTVLPMRDFGIFTAIGVLSSIIIALFFIPSILLVKHSMLSGGTKGKDSAFANSVGKFISILFRFVTAHSKMVLFIFVIILGASLYFTQDVILDNTVVNYFKKTTNIRMAEEAISRNFAGINSFDIVMESKDPGGVLDPVALTKLETIRTWLTAHDKHVTKVVGYTDFIKRINQALHAGEPGEFSVSTDTGPAMSEEPAGEDFSGFWSEDTENSGLSESDEDSFFFSDNEGDSVSENTPAEDSFGSFFDDSQETSLQDTQSNDINTSYDNNRTTVNSEVVLSALFTAYGRSGKNADLDDVMHELKRMLNYNGYRYYEIPNDPDLYGLQNDEELKELISQYLLLFSGNLSSYSDDSLEPKHIRMTVFLKSSSTLMLRDLRKDLEPYLDSLFADDAVSVSISGSAVAEESLTNRIVESALLSIAISVVLVCIVLMFTYRSLKPGLVGSLALSITILVNFGIMGYFKIPLDISTALFGSIAIGIGIDYVIHFLNAYTLGLTFTGEPRLAIEHAYKTTGKPIVFNALSVAAGFSVLVFSNFNPLMYLGILITVTMIVSSLCSLTLVPALLYSFNIRFRNRSINLDNEKTPLEVVT